MEKYREFGNIIMDTIKDTYLMIAEMDDELSQEELESLMDKNVQVIFNAAMDRVKAQMDKTPPRRETKQRIARKRK
jgi:hypothetical protein